MMLNDYWTTYFDGFQKKQPIRIASDYN